MIRATLGAAVASLALAASVVAAPARSLQHVTLIGDSVGASLSLPTHARAIVSGGTRMDLQTAVCRRLEDPSCPPDPPTALDLIHSLGAEIGPSVVIEVGYNDFAAHYATEVSDVLAALEAVHVQHVFWLTLRAAHHPYIDMNAEIEAARAQHPELTVLDWNAYSRSHPSWFQADGIHPTYAGTLELAGFIHRGLVAAGIAVAAPRVVTSTLPAGRRGSAYAVRLRAAGGWTPYTWSLTGRLPPGLRLRPGGQLSGTPDRGDRTGVYTVVVRVGDASGQASTRKLLLPLRK